MLLDISRPDSRDKASPSPSGNDFLLYIDTLRVMLPRQLTDSERWRLNLFAGKKIYKARPAPPFARQHGWFYTLQLNQPNELTLRTLQNFGIEHAITRLHISVDIEIEDQRQRERLQRWCRQHLVVRWRSTQRIWQQYGVDYFARKGASRNLVAYADRRSKVTDEMCLHVELRLQRAATMRDLALRTIDTLTADKLWDVFEKNVGAYQVMDGFDLRVEIDERIERIVQRWARRRRSRLGFMASEGEAEALRIARRMLRRRYCHKLFGCQFDGKDDRIACGTRWEKVAYATNLLRFLPKLSRKRLKKVDLFEALKRLAAQ